MTLNRPALLAPRARFTALALCLVLPAAMAQTAPPKTLKPAMPARKVVAPKPVELVPPPASTEQIEAAGQVFYGVYECEFKQTIHIVANPKYAAFVDVKHGKVDYLMKPVLSSTGAIRLEDIRGQTLMVQISSKSMVLNVKTGQRVVDDCITPKQRELVEAARAAKVEAAAAAAAVAAASAASVASAASAVSAASAPAASALAASEVASAPSTMTTIEPVPIK